MRTFLAIGWILGILLFSAAFALSEDVRVATLNIVLEVMDDHTRITFEEDPSGGAGQSGSTGQPDTTSGLEYHYNIALEWIPEGFILDGGNYEENGTSDYVVYRSQQDGMINVSVTPYSAGLTGSFSTEDCEKKRLQCKTIWRPCISQMTICWRNDIIKMGLQISGVI
mgnify:FL=1